MTSVQNESGNEERGLNPADVQNVRFTRASMLRPGYVDTEVDRVMSRVAEELARHIAEKAQLRNEVRALRAQRRGHPRATRPPSEQAVRILSSAQQTADAYVAEAEEFSRQMTSEARAVYEEEVRQARENAGAIIQAAQEAAAKMTGGGVAGADTGARSMRGARGAGRLPQGVRSGLPGPAALLPRGAAQRRRERVGPRRPRPAAAAAPARPRAALLPGRAGRLGGHLLREHGDRGARRTRTRTRAARPGRVPVRAVRR